MPGVVYSDGEEATPFQVEDREIRVILTEGHALFDLVIEGSDPVPVVIKEQQHHPVRGNVQHLDLQRVRLDEAIQSEVAIELEGVEDAPGVKGGGVLEHVVREVTVEALPTDIPDSLTMDVSDLEINETATMSRLVVPAPIKVAAGSSSPIASSRCSMNAGNIWSSCSGAVMRRRRASSSIDPAISCSNRHILRPCRPVAAFWATGIFPAPINIFRPRVAPLRTGEYFRPQR